MGKHLIGHMEVGSEQFNGLLIVALWFPWTRSTNKTVDNGQQRRFKGPWAECEKDSGPLTAL